MLNLQKSKSDAVTSQFGLQQLIIEPTHILGNSSSCTHLIFTSHPSLVCRHSNCHHQITYVKFNLEIQYPPPYERKILRRLILIILEKQSNSLLGTGHLKIKALTKWYFYLIEVSKIFFRTIFYMKLEPVK